MFATEQALEAAAGRAKMHVDVLFLTHPEWTTTAREAALVEAGLYAGIAATLEMLDDGTLGEAGRLPPARSPRG